MAITPEQARAELARRELARRELSRRETAEKPKPMFATEEEGRKASTLAEQERGRLAFNASPVGFTANQIIGGANSAIDTALGSLPERAYNLFGKTMMPDGTAESVKSIGSGIGMSVPFSPASKTAQAAFNAFLSSSPVKNISRVVSSKEGNKFATELQKEFVNIKRAATDKFGQQIDDLAIKNPEAKVSIRGIVDDIKGNADLSPEARNVFRKTPILRDLLDDPSKADGLSISDAQKIINYMQTKVPANIRANNLDLIEALSDIRASQLDAFPEMSAVRAEYAKVAEPWKNLKQYFKFNKTLSAIKGDFGGPQGKEAIESIFPKETIKAMGGYKKAERAVKFVKDALAYTGAATALGVGGKAGYDLVK